VADDDGNDESSWQAQVRQCRELSHRQSCSLLSLFSSGLLSKGRSDRDAADTAVDRNTKSRGASTGREAMLLLLNRAALG
jgi:hypothetical protein